jgi:co-chaperonin GroES (HSP10)
MQLLHDRVLIRRIEERETLVGCLVIPDIAQVKGIKGMVLAVGPGKWHPGEFWKIKGKWEWLEGWREAPSVLPGQIVYFNSKWNDAEQLQDGLHLVMQGDVFAIEN